MLAPAEPVTMPLRLADKYWVCCYKIAECHAYTPVVLRAGGLGQGVNPKPNRPRAMLSTHQRIRLTPPLYTAISFASSEK